MKLNFWQLYTFTQFKNRSLAIFEIAKKMEFGKKKNLIALFDFTSFLVGTFLILWRPTVQCDLFFFLISAGCFANELQTWR